MIYETDLCRFCDTGENQIDNPSPTETVDPAKAFLLLMASFGRAYHQAVEDVENEKAEIEMNRKKEEELARRKASRRIGQETRADDSSIFTSFHSSQGVGQHDMIAKFKQRLKSASSKK